LVPSCRSVPSFFTDTATSELYPPSLHDALPISGKSGQHTTLYLTKPSKITRILLIGCGKPTKHADRTALTQWAHNAGSCLQRLRSEEHTSELQSRENLVCRLLLEKKKYE